MARVIYILQDSGRPDLVKIGKDSAWPLRYRQASCTSPRQIRCLAVWRYPDAATLNAAERQAQAGFISHDTGNGNTEWFPADAESAIHHVSTALGRQADETSGTSGPHSWDDVQPWDAWRDAAKYTRTNDRRRLWLGAEIGHGGAIGAIKAVHSPYYDTFYQFTPTYACSRLRWLGWWQAPGPCDETGNRAIYDLWIDLVTKHGQGPDDLRVGWLRQMGGSPAVDLLHVVGFIEARGMVAGDPTGPKPMDTRRRDPSLGGKLALPVGVVPDQRMIHRWTRMAA